MKLSAHSCKYLYTVVILLKQCTSIVVESSGAIRILVRFKSEILLSIDVVDGKENLNKSGLFIFTQLFGTTFLCVVT